MLAGMDLALVKDLPHMAAVLQQVCQGALAIRYPSPRLTVGQDQYLCPDALLAHLFQRPAHRAELQIHLKQPAHLFSLIRHDDEFLVPVDVAQGDIAPMNSPFFSCGL